MADMTADRREPWDQPAVLPLMETVDDRLRRLEQALATMQNTAVVEDVVAERVVARLTSTYDAGLMPALTEAVLPAMAAQAADAAAGGFWTRLQVFKELRLMARMYLDPRYRLSRTGQFGVPIVVGLMFLNYLTFNWVIAIPLLPFVGTLAERTVLVVLAVVLYKVLAREAARYEAVLNYLARYTRP
ncbi:MAG: hypothetical protein U0871_29285 [Gemmataceae bacterium]